MSCHVILCHACELWSLNYSHAMRTMACHAMCACAINAIDVIHESHDMCVPASQDGTIIPSN